jgi:PPOX class probable F420-dependent enzyme
MPGGSPRVRTEASRIARLATVRPDGTPNVVPITFAIDGEILVSAVDSKPKRTTNLQRLQNLRGNAAVSVVIDRYDDDWSTLWWVRLDGVADIVDRGPDWTRAIDALVAKYAQYRDNPPVGPAIIVRPARWTAWSAVPATAGE